jgi:hypothetical protein
MKEDEMAGHVERIGMMKNSYKIFIGKPENRLFGRHRHR